MDEKQAKPRRPLWFWLFVGLGVVVLIFGLGAPRALSNASEEEVTYDVFLTALEEGKVQEVELKSGTLYYTLKEAAQPAPTAAPQLNFGFRTLSGGSRKCSRAAAPVCGFSRGTTARSVSLSWGAREVGSP